MRLLLDAHMPNTLIHELLADGHNIVRAALAHPDWADDRLLALAVRDDRIIVTEDSHFSELIFGKEHDAPPSVLYLQSAPQELVELISQLRLAIESGRINGHMVVIRRDTIRYRAFPER